MEVEQHTLSDEARLNMTMMSFWWDRRGECRLPTQEDFDPIMLAEVWRSCFMLVPCRPPQQSVFQYIGETIGESLGVTDKAIIP